MSCGLIRLDDNLAVDSDTGTPIDSKSSLQSMARQDCEVFYNTRLFSNAEL
jgi:hypothetical protein